MSRCTPKKRRALRNRSGQGLIEYVLIIALTSIGLMLVLLLLRDGVGNGMDNISNGVQSVSGTSQYQPGGSGSTARPGGGRGAGNGRGRGPGTGN